MNLLKEVGKILNLNQNVQQLFHFKNLQFK